MNTKLNFSINDEVLQSDVTRLTNQIWKLIPMKENNENWHSQLVSILNELIGLNEIFNFSTKYLILLSKLEGLKIQEIEFIDYRKTVFESITLLKEVCADVKYQ